VRITAWTYAIYCLTVWPIHAFDTARDLSTGARTGIVVLCVGCAAAALSATRRKRIGYRFCYMFSLLVLAGLPFGTILAWNMLRALRQNRHQFWPSRPRAAWMQRYERGKTRDSGAA
jgi:hypothetical protein